MIPATTTRVQEHTADHVNNRILQQTLSNVRCFASADRTEIDRRLHELEREWDIERTLETNAAGAMLLGLGLAMLVSRRWLLLSAVVGGFLLQHAVQGWCPPLVWFRRMGIRTQREIELERHALRVLRGDFQDLPIHDDGRIDVDRTFEELRRRQNGSIRP